MFFSEIISGLIFYKMNINFLSKYEKKNKEFEYMKIQLIQEEYNEMIRNDSEIKIFFLIFLIAFYDFMEFSIKTYFLPQFNDISDSLVVRLRNIVTISSTLLCYYLYKFPLYKHHKISLLIIFICLILIIFLEYLENLEKLVLLTLIIFTIILEHFFNSFKDVIEKYILEYDNINPFQALMIEGIFGFIMTCIYLIEDHPFDEIKDFFKDNKDEKFKIAGLIICLIFYFLFSGGKNIYRILTNKLYSPITKGSSDSILDPFLIGIYYYSDFKNTFQFIYNLILSIIMDFWVCVYNELFVLFCCNLEHDTYIIVSMRAAMNEILGDDNDSDSDD